MLLSVVGWVQVFEGRRADGPGGWCTGAGSWGVLGLQARQIPWLSLLVQSGWMALAMTPMLVLPAVTWCWNTSQARNRVFVLGSHLVGYAAAWVFGCTLIMLGGMMLRLTAGLSLCPLALLLWLALVCRRDRSAAFLNGQPVTVRPGLDAALWNGMRHGACCLGSCGLFMLLPGLLPRSWQWPAMIGVNSILVAARYAGVQVRSYLWSKQSSTAPDAQLLPDSGTLQYAMPAQAGAVYTLASDNAGSFARHSHPRGRPSVEARVFL